MVCLFSLLRNHSPLSFCLHSSIILLFISLFVCPSACLFLFYAFQCSDLSSLLRFSGPHKAYLVQKLELIYVRCCQPTLAKGRNSINHMEQNMLYFGKFRIITNSINYIFTMNSVTVPISCHLYQKHKNWRLALIIRDE